MPDFPSPPGGGATAAQVWGYATRSLNSDASNAIRDAILSDAQKIAGSNIDAAISSRGPADEYDAALAALDTDVLSRAPSGEYDTEMAHLDADVSTRADGSEYTAGRAAKIDKVQDFLEEATGTLSATGSEDTIKEITNTVNKLHCFVDLTNMASGDTITVRQYMKIKSAGSYILYAEESYSDAQTLPMLYIVTKPAKYGIKITLEQTAGTNRDYDWQTFQEKAAA
jgi:hypothetical protein